MAADSHRGVDATGGVSMPMQPNAEDARPEQGIISDDTMPAIIELLVFDDANTAKQAASKSDPAADAFAETQRALCSQPSGKQSSHLRQASQGKVMTASQFEMYRHAKGMHRGEMGAESDDSGDEYEDKDDDEDKRKEAALRQRQRQESYLAAQRLERRKVSGGADKKTPEISAVMEISLDDWQARSRTPSPLHNVLGARSSPDIQEDDDDDVPLAMLVRSQTPGIPGGPVQQRRVSPQGQPHHHQHPHHYHQPQYFVERPQTRMRSHSPGPQLHSHTPAPQFLPRAQTPGLAPPQNMGHQRGISMGMGNASLLSLAAQPQVQRPHTSGGLVGRIDTLQSPNSFSGRLKPEPQKNFLGVPVNPRKFYGRWTG